VLSAGVATTAGTQTQTGVSARAFAPGQLKQRGTLSAAFILGLGARANLQAGASLSAKAFAPGS